MHVFDADPFEWVIEKTTGYEMFEFFADRLILWEDKDSSLYLLT